MAPLGHGILVGFQVLILALTAAGWGYWVWRLAGARAAPRAEDAVLCGLAGLGGGWVILQDILYAGLRMRYAAWIGAAAAAAGLAGLARERRRSRRGARGAPRRAGGRWAAGVLAAVFVFQAWGLVDQGPYHYYGYGRQDQVNYVQLAEFLIEKPFATSLSEVGLHPWLVKAIDTKGARIGEAVANAYEAVLAGTDAQAAYGTTSVFLVALMAAAVFALLRGLGAAPLLAGAGSLWAGLLPAITQIHLDGFFSQSAVLFVLPALALATRVAARDFRLGLAAACLLLAFLFSAYTELYVVGWAMTLLLIAASGGRPGLSRGRRLAFAGACTVAPLALLASYCPHGLSFLAGQYQGAEQGAHLAEWMPRAGTWRGWGEVYLTAPKARAGLIAAATLAGAAFLVAMAAGIGLSRSRPRRRWLAAFAAVPAALLLALLVKRPFPQYAFGKLCVSFAPLAVTLVVLGLARLIAWARPAASRRFAPGAVIVLAALAAWGSATKQLVVVRGGAGLPSVAFPAVTAVYRELEAHPERRYSIVETHYIINSWLCYYARRSPVYTPLPQIGDRRMPADEFAFRKPPPAAGPPLWVVSAWGMHPARR